MTATWPGKSVKVTGALLASLLLNLPIDFYQSGRTNIVLFSSAIAAPFIGIAVLEFFRHAGRFQKFFAQRGFEGMLLRTFMCTLPLFVANVLGAVSPTPYSGGLQFGMAVGSATAAPFATLDRPQVTDLRYWDEERGCDRGCSGRRRLLRGRPLGCCADPGPGSGV